MLTIKCLLYSTVNSLLICAQVYYSHYLIHLYSEQLNEALRRTTDQMKLYGGLRTTAKTGRTAKTTTSHVHHGFFWLHFLAVVALLRYMELPNFTRPLYGVGHRSTKIFFFLTQIRSFRIQPQRILSTLNTLNETE